MPLARLQAPFDHPDWIFEPKMDGFRAVAYVEHGAGRLVSRNGNIFKSFPALTSALAAALPVQNAILDGESVYLGPDGAPLFSDLMRRRTRQHFMAFDLLFLDGRDLRMLPLLERKGLLRQVIPPQPSPVLYVDYVARSGLALFHAICAWDMEGIVAKLESGVYAPEATTWVRVKSRTYSQAEGRADFFDSRAAKGRRLLLLAVPQKTRLVV